MNRLEKIENLLIDTSKERTTLFNENVILKRRITELQEELIKVKRLLHLAYDKVSTGQEVHCEI